MFLVAGFRKSHLPGIVAYAYNPSTQEVREEYYCDFKASLGYIVVFKANLYLVVELKASLNYVTLS